MIDDVVVLKKYRGRLSFLPVPAFAKNSNPFSGETTIRERNECTKSGHHLSACLPPLNEPVPDDWTVVCDDFVMVYTAHTSHMSKDCFLAPNARLDDGVIWLLYLTANLSKSQILTFLTSLESGKHVNLPYVNLVPVRAFRLEPENDVGVMTIDGELIETGPLQCCVLPSVANVMSR
jgi:sphingosine kinase